MTSIVNVTTLARAGRMAQARAEHEYTIQAQTEPVDDVWELRDAKDIFHSLTGEKYPSENDLWLVQDAYEDAYYEKFEELKG